MSLFEKKMPLVVGHVEQACWASEFSNMVDWMSWWFESAFASGG
jgi:hypothetical protein